MRYTVFKSFSKLIPKYIKIYSAVAHQTLRSEALISRCVSLELFLLDLRVINFTSCFIWTIICVNLILIGFQNKNRVAILAELDKEKRRLQSQSMNSPGARYCLNNMPLLQYFICVFQCSLSLFLSLKKPCC